MGGAGTELAVLGAVSTARSLKASPCTTIIKNTAAAHRADTAAAISASRLPSTDLYCSGCGRTREYLASTIRFRSDLPGNRTSLSFCVKPGTEIFQTYFPPVAFSCHEEIFRSPPT